MPNLQLNEHGWLMPIICSLTAEIYTFIWMICGYVSSKGNKQCHWSENWIKLYMYMYVCIYIIWNWSYWYNLILCVMKRTRIVRESIPRQVDKKSGGPQGERGLEFSRRRKGQTFFPLHSLGLYNNNVSCLRIVYRKNLLANPVILKCKLLE